MINAAKQYDPSHERQKSVIKAAIASCGSLTSLCVASGLSRDYLTRLKKGQRTWTFQVQFLLENIAKEGRKQC